MTLGRDKKQFIDAASNANEFKPRRNAAAIAEVRIRDAAEASKNKL